MRTVLALAAALVFVCAPPAAGREPETGGEGAIAPAWSWPEAGPVRYAFSRVSTEISPTPGRDFRETREISRVVRHERVVDPDLGGEGTPLRLGWEWVRFVNDSNFGERLEYDSREPHHWTRTSVPGIGRLAAVVGESMVVRMRPDGTLGAVGDLEPLIRGMEANLSRWGLFQETLYDELSAAYTAESIRESTEPLYAFLPRGPVKAGESHEVARVLLMPQVGLMRSVETHTLDRIEATESGGRVAVFRVEGEVRWPEPPPAIAERFSVAVNESRVTGEWRFDLERGLALSYEVEASFAADVVRFDPADRSSVEVPTRQTLRETMRLLDGEPGEPGDTGE